MLHSNMTVLLSFTHTHVIASSWLLWNANSELLKMTKVSYFIWLMHYISILLKIYDSFVWKNWLNVIHWRSWVHMKKVAIAWFFNKVFFFVFFWVRCFQWIVWSSSQYPSQWFIHKSQWLTAHWRGRLSLNNGLNSIYRAPDVVLFHFWPVCCLMFLIHKTNGSVYRLIKPVVAQCNF